MKRGTYAVVVLSVCVLYIAVTVVDLLLDPSGDNYIFVSWTNRSKPIGYIIWSVFHIWQILWLFYGVANIFRRTETGFACNDPVLMKGKFWGCFALSKGLNLAFILLIEFGYKIPGLCALVFFVVLLFVCLILSYKTLQENLITLRNSGRNTDIWLMRILVQNGLAGYVIWSSINMTFYRLSLIIAGIGFITGIMVLSVVLDFFILDRFTRYIITPNIAFVMALINIPSRYYSIGIIVLMVVVVVLLIAKITVTIWRHRKYPNSSAEACSCCKESDPESQVGRILTHTPVHINEINAHKDEINAHKDEINAHKDENSKGISIVSCQ